MALCCIAHNLARTNKKDGGGGRAGLGVVVIEDGGASEKVEG